MCELIELQQDMLSKLRCRSCNSYLSVPPISGRQGFYICGRCAPNEPNNDLYWEIAQFTIFPCSNDGCYQKLLWDYVQLHEDHCSYRRINCPDDNCNEKYKLTSMLDHFEKYHEYYRHNDRVRGIPVRLKDVDQHRNIVHVLTHNGIQFLVFVRINSELNGNSLRYKCLFAVFSIPSLIDENFAKQWRYQVSLKMESRSEESNLVRQGETTFFDDNRHCYRCLDNHCLERNHNKSNNCFFQINFSDLDYRNNMHLSYIIRLYPNKIIVHDNKLVQTFECPICSIYMCRPIYNCIQGHSLCVDCRQKIIECPFCKCDMGTSRNFALEQMAETVQLPCQNAQFGCQVKGSASQMNEHHKEC